MPFLLSQNKKIMIAVVTVALIAFSTFMLIFQENDEATLSTKASIIHSQDDHSETGE